VIRCRGGVIESCALFNGPRGGVPEGEFLRRVGSGLGHFFLVDCVPCELKGRCANLCVADRTLFFLVIVVEWIYGGDAWGCCGDLGGWVPLFG